MNKKEKKILKELFDNNKVGAPEMSAYLTLLYSNLQIKQHNENVKKYKNELIEIFKDLPKLRIISRYSRQYPYDFDIFFRGKLQAEIRHIGGGGGIEFSYNRADGPLWFKNHGSAKSFSRLKLTIKKFALQQRLAFLL